MDILEELKKEFPEHKLELTKKSNRLIISVNGIELKLQYSYDSIRNLQENFNLNFERELIHILKEEIKQHIK